MSSPASPHSETRLDSALYVVSTPIGNLRDITLRALDVLANVSLIYAEDTRVTAKLLQAHGLRTRLSPYHDHNAANVRPEIISRIAGGEALALVSDAGTPLISDPGYKLVAALAEANLKVIPIPGASAVLAGLVVAGLPTDRFLFGGFLPPRASARRRAAEEFAGVQTTLLFYETGPRLAESLADLAAVLGPRHAVVARELTKLFEEARRGTLAELAQHYQLAGPPKGEIVLVIGPPEAQAQGPNGSELDAALLKALNVLSVRAASIQVAAALGMPRREVYARALHLRPQAPDTDAV